MENMTATANTTKEKNTIKAKKIEIKVKGMHCRSCETLIKDALEEMDGVSKAEASENEGKVIVHYDQSKIDLDKIKDAINSEGYTTE